MIKRKGTLRKRPMLGEKAAYDKKERNVKCERKRQQMIKRKGT